MGTKTTTWCDHCKKPDGPGIHITNYIFGQWNSWDKSFDLSGDLCQECANEALTYMRTFMEKDKEDDFTVLGYDPLQDAGG